MVYLTPKALIASSAVHLGEHASPWRDDIVAGPMRKTGRPSSPMPTAVGAGTAWRSQGVRAEEWGKQCSRSAVWANRLKPLPDFGVRAFAPKCPRAHTILEFV